MYTLVWDEASGGVRLVDVPGKGDAAISTDIRPVYHEELDLLGFDALWRYPRGDAPLLWTTSTGHVYLYRGRPVAKVAGGGLFERPRIVSCEEGLELEPVDVPAMVAANADMLRAMAHEAIAFIDDVTRRRRRATDVVSVAFSGGKDSLALLDLARRALPPAAFHVIFSDTTMEIGPTLEAVAAARARWPELSFHTARCHMDAAETWRQFGPPSRIHRWCCAVHKSTPSLLKLREITGLPGARALVLDGVRAGESENRATYDRVSVGRKHATQTNASPLFHWSAMEVHLYLFQHDLLLNRAYRHGFSRVGCCVCPMSSKWSDYLVSQCCEKDARPFVELLQNYAQGCDRREDLHEYLNSRAWKVRSGGRHLESGGNRTLFQSLNSSIEITMQDVDIDLWLQWLQAMGRVIRTSPHEGEVVCSKAKFSYAINSATNRITIDNLVGDRAMVVTSLKSIANKTAYCLTCKACMAQCRHGAISMNGVVKIDQSLCRQCRACLTITEHGCHAARSLRTTREVVSLKGLNRYQSFGMQQQWLETFFRSGDAWWERGILGTLHHEAMDKWLVESEIVSKKLLTPFGNLVKRLPMDSSFTWSMIWINLFYNSRLVPWYLSAISWKKSMARNDLKATLQDIPADRTKENVIKTLLQLLRETPLGASLGLGIVTKHGSSPTILPDGLPEDKTESLAILYCLYRHAAATNRYHFSVENLEAATDGGPFHLFGITRDTFVKVARSLSTSHGALFSSDIVANLTNISLKEHVTPLEVVHLASRSL